MIIDSSNSFNHSADELLSVRDIQTLVRSMSVGLWAQNTSNNKLSLREQDIQHVNEGNGTTFSCIQGIFSIEVL